MNELVEFTLTQSAATESA